MGPILADDFAFGDFVLWVLYVVALVILFWLLFVVITDLFARHDVSGGAKAAWLIFVLFLPMLGILVYLITQGDGMAHRVQSARHRALVAAGFSLADELAKLEKLHKEGKLSDEEYQRIRARLIG
jgi:hypothetical protein